MAIQITSTMSGTTLLFIGREKLALLADVDAIIDALAGPQDSIIDFCEARGYKVACPDYEDVPEDIEILASYTWRF